MEREMSKSSEVFYHAADDDFGLTIWPCWNVPITLEQYEEAEQAIGLARMEPKGNA